MARLQAQSCDGIARILEVFEDSRSLALVIEHPNGGTLLDAQSENQLQNQL